MTIGLLFPVVLAAVRRPVDAFRTENLILGGMVYWILLDLLQGQKEPEAVSPGAVRSAFLAMGLFAGSVCLANAFPACASPPRSSARPRFRSPRRPCSLRSRLLCVLGDGALRRVVRFRSTAHGPVPRATSVFGAVDGDAAGQFAGVSGAPGLFRLSGADVDRVARASARVDCPPDVAGVLCSAIILLFAAQGGSRGEIGVIAGAAIPDVAPAPTDDHVGRGVPTVRHHLPRCSSGCRSC